jgi:hypothetical protein
VLSAIRRSDAGSVDEIAIQVAIERGPRRRAVAEGGAQVTVERVRRESVAVEAIDRRGDLRELVSEIAD